METVTDACWALSYLSDGPNERIQAVLHAGVAPKLVELLGHVNSSVQTPALRTVGNIVTGTDEQTQFIINLNAIPALLWLLDHQKKNIRKEACWTISNITAGTADQIQGVVEQSVFPKLIDLLSSSEFDIKKEAAWAVSNATSGGRFDQILYIVQKGAVPPLCNLLDAPDTKIVTVALEGLENILKAGVGAGEEVNKQFIQLIAECEGVDKIERLQEHENPHIYQQSSRIIDQYFAGEDEDEEGNLMPELQSGSDGQQQYSFGGQAPGPSAGGNVFNFGN
jgi:hypothetical protein